MLNNELICQTNETLEILKKDYADKILSRSTVFEEFKRFKDGRDFLQSDEHKGHPRRGWSPDQIMKFSGILKKRPFYFLKIDREHDNRQHKHNSSIPDGIFKEKEDLFKICPFLFSKS